MRRDIVERILDEGAFIAETGATVRACAAKFGVGKSTVHKDMRARLPGLDRRLARRVNAVLKINLEQRHIRGGAATRAKYSPK